jgi:probable H4MPT-linked C1 transfer pathway protein
MSAEPPVLGWDLGGAHLKAARVDPGGGISAVVQLPSPLWQGLGHLESAMTAALERLGPAPTHAVTMTGEMADLFPSRAAGVRAILKAATVRLAPSRMIVFAGRSGFLARAQAEERPLEVASANWLASAILASRKLQGGMLIDIGSTTTDIIPFDQGRVLARGSNDHERLAMDELVYTGIVRTPVMALTDRVVFEGASQPVVAELFATMADVHRVNGSLPDDSDQLPAADGGAKTVEDSARRLARMLGRDFESHGMAAWKRLAAQLADIQARRIETACRDVLARSRLGRDAPLVGAGCGRFLVREFARRLGRRYVDFADLVEAAPEARHEAGNAAPAASVACLALLE